MKARIQINLVTKSIIAKVETQIESLREDKALSVDAREIAIFELRKTIDMIREDWKD